MSDINQQVLEMKERYRNTWRDKSPAFWYRQFIEEVGQLGVALIHQDEAAISFQLRRIASIALNWLEMRESANDTQVND